MESKRLHSKRLIDKWIDENYDNYCSIIYAHFKSLDVSTEIYEKLIKMNVDRVKQLIDDNEFNYYLVSVVKHHLYSIKPNYNTDVDFSKLDPNTIICDELIYNTDTEDNTDEEIIKHYVYQNFKFVKMMRRYFDDSEMSKVILRLDELGIDDLNGYAEYFKQHLNYFEYELIKLCENLTYREIQKETDISSSSANILVNKAMNRINKRLWD